MEVIKLLHAGCGVIVLALAVGLYRSGARPQSIETALMRLPMIGNLALIGLLTVLLGSSLGWIRGVLSFAHFLTDALGLIVHEAGHFFTSWAGNLLYALGGTLFEIGIPAGLAIWCAIGQYYKILSLMLGWMSVALFSVSAYAGDAQALELPLLGGTGDPEFDAQVHDWHSILSQLGWLEATRTVSDSFWALGLVSGVAAILLYGWTLQSGRRISLDMVDEG